jgi:hypothetical protein
MTKKLISIFFTFIFIISTFSFFLPNSVNTEAAAVCRKISIVQTKDPVIEEVNCATTKECQNKSIVDKNNGTYYECYQDAARQVLESPKGATLDPCEAYFATGEVIFASEKVSCSLNPAPKYDANGFAQFKPTLREEYRNYLCSKINNPAAEKFSSVVHNETFTCQNGAVVGVPTKTSQYDPSLTQNAIYINKIRTTAPTQVKNNTNASSDEFLGKNFGCRINKTTIKLVDVINISNFVPIIPNQCTTLADGSAIPLSPILIPQILTRLFGFLASFVFYILTGALIFNGVLWIYGGIDGKSNATAKRNFGDLAWAFLLLLGTYTIIATIVGLVGGSSIETDLSSYFTNNITK